MVNVEKRRLHMCTLNHIHHGNNHISHIYIAYGLGQFLIHANPHPNGTPATQAIVRPAHQALLKFTPNFFGVTYMQCTLVFTIPMYGEYQGKYSVSYKITPVLIFNTFICYIS